MVQSTNSDSTHKHPVEPQTPNENTKTAEVHEVSPSGSPSVSLEPASRPVAFPLVPCTRNSSHSSPPKNGKKRGGSENDTNRVVARKHSSEQALSTQEVPTTEAQQMVHLKEKEKEKGQASDTPKSPPKVPPAKINVASTSSSTSISTERPAVVKFELNETSEISTGKSFMDLTPRAQALAVLKSRPGRRVFMSDTSTTLPSSSTYPSTNTGVSSISQTASASAEPSVHPRQQPDELPPLQPTSTQTSDATSSSSPSRLFKREASVASTDSSLTSLHTSPEGSPNQPAAPIPIAKRTRSTSDDLTSTSGATRGKRAKNESDINATKSQHPIVQEPMHIPVTTTDPTRSKVVEGKRVTRKLNPNDIFGPHASDPDGSQEHERPNVKRPRLTSDDPTSNSGAIEKRAKTQRNIAVRSGEPESVPKQLLTPDLNSDNTLTRKSAWDPSHPKSHMITPRPIPYVLLPNANANNRTIAVSPASSQEQKGSQSRDATTEALTTKPLRRIRRSSNESTKKRTSQSNSNNPNTKSSRSDVQMKEGIDSMEVDPKPASGDSINLTSNGDTTQPIANQASDIRNSAVSSTPPTTDVIRKLQDRRCQSVDYLRNFQCVSCQKRQSGDTCRFLYVRSWGLDSKSNNFLGTHTFKLESIENIERKSPKLPKAWNVPITEEHTNQIKLTVAKVLFPVLQQEIEHLSLPNIVYRPRDVDVRITCDVCLTSIFSGSWMCLPCGRELCSECFALIKGYEDYKSQPITSRRKGPKSDSEAVRRDRILTCSRAKDNKRNHFEEDFSPVTRFDRKEVERAVETMKCILRQDKEGRASQGGPSIYAATPVAPCSPAIVDPSRSSSPQVPLPVSQPKTAPQPDSTTSALVYASPYLDPTRPLIRAPPSFYPQLYEALYNKPLNHQVPSFHPFYPLPISPTTETDLPIHVPLPQKIQLPTLRYPVLDDTKSSNLSRDPSGLKTHPLTTFTHKDLSEDTFRQLWAKGEPLVVTGLMEKAQLSWTPEYFIKNYGDQNCEVVECQSNQTLAMKVGDFFAQFGNYSGRKTVLKLKDWPETSEFKTQFPELFIDFSRMVPIPNYARRDGVLNLAAHFPSDAIAPDIGPKMYNAFESSELPGGQGSTRLHMDMADAVNILLYAAPRADGSPGFAAWDIFRAEDASKIREYLTIKFRGQFNDDPIHTQFFYLDAARRRELFQQFGVLSWRIYQAPGQAVFIPAGCAHQVCNLADCIKVAVDFVSTENIERCEVLTQEFREQNQTVAWKEDVLQLRATMWYAWLSCCRVEQEIHDRTSPEIVA